MIIEGDSENMHKQYMEGVCRQEVLKERSESSSATNMLGIQVA